MQGIDHSSIIYSEFWFRCAVKDHCRPQVKFVSIEDWDKETSLRVRSLIKTGENLVSPQWQWNDTSFVLRLLNVISQLFPYWASSPGRPAARLRSSILLEARPCVGVSSTYIFTKDPWMFLDSSLTGNRNIESSRESWWESWGTPTLISCISYDWLLTTTLIDPIWKDW